MINVEFSNRGLTPHKFMPMLGVHKTLKPTFYLWGPLRSFAPQVKPLQPIKGCS
jgi:hypothetical protein